MGKEAKKPERISESIKTFVDGKSRQQKPVKIKRELDEIQAVVKNWISRKSLPQDVQLEVNKVVRGLLKKLDVNDVAAAKEIMDLLVDIKK